jgi:hypothetical protein
MRSKAQKRRDEEIRLNSSAKIIVKGADDSAFIGSGSGNFLADEHGTVGTVIQNEEMQPVQSITIPISSDLDEIYQLKMKKIDEDIYAMPIEKVGCIVRVNSSVVFVPNAALSPDGDGNFDLILGKVYK